MTKIEVVYEKNPEKLLIMIEKIIINIISGCIAGIMAIFVFVFVLPGMWLFYNLGGEKWKLN